MPLFSDRISHAFAFSAKHYGKRVPVQGEMGYFAYPSSVAVLLARYGCDETTIVAGILHHVVEEALPGERAVLERKIREKFGPVVLAVVLDGVEPRFDERGHERPWQLYKRDYLAQLAVADPRSLDVCIADEIHDCGSAISVIRRLGTEYLDTVSDATRDQTLWWYRSVLEVLERREDWPNRCMLDELRLLSAELMRALGGSER
ncbi:MAG: HD domain-containing protein [Gemmatimonadota bacterium]